MYETNHSPAPVLKFIRNGRAGAGFGAILLAGVLMASALTACAPAGQRRSAGTVLDDQTYETRAIDVLFSRDEFGTNDHIKVEVHNATLLMAGETQSEANKQLATELTSQLRGIKRVVNELEVMPPSTAAERLNNSYMTSKVNSVLTTKNPVAGFDATRIKVLTARNIVYLMGTVTRAEGDAVTEVVRNIGGVSRVVKVFDYTD
jgi:osmotically-inducible protein OsmY